MKSRIKKKLSFILGTVGILLIISAVSIGIIEKISERRSAENVKVICDELISLLPEITDGISEEMRDLRMPSLQLDGIDYIGVINVPAFDKELPVSNIWNKNKVSSYPCRYTGSLYDGSLIIGGSSADGQFDFVKDIMIGEKLHFTDTRGLRYSLVVSDIRQTKDVSGESLKKRKGDLILFARNPFAFDYTVICCSFK